MSLSSGILRYLAECYRENGSRLGVTSLGSERVRRSLVVKGVDAVVSASVLDGQLFVPGSKAAELARQAQLYEKECELFYGSVFVAGNVETGEARLKPVFAPLLLYRAEVERIDGEGGAEFVIGTGQRMLNDALLEAIGDEALAARLEAGIDRETHSEGCVGEIRRLFAEAIPGTVTEALLNYPHLLDEEGLGNEGLKHPSASRAKAASLSLLPAAVLFLADRSREMRGVLNDLAAMAEASEARAGLSPPVQQLLDGGGAARAGGRVRRGEVPALLSEAQERIAVSASCRPLTLAVGPPGTGKSFTIAALAMEAVSRGESVLIASKMDHAVDVVADKIEETLGLPGLCVRAGRKNYLRDLKQFLDELLAGMHSGPAVASAGKVPSKARLGQLRAEIARRERLLEKRWRHEERMARLREEANPGWFTRWRLGREREAVRRRDPLVVLNVRLDEAWDALVAETTAYFKALRASGLARALRRDRATFQAFAKGLRARSAKKQEDYFAEVGWRKLLGALPVWLVNLSDVHRVLPLEKGLFDLVIIDEASQCDIASALPALQRAKRAVITGDPKQLRHVSFLPVARQEEFARQHGLGEETRERFHFRRTSLVDLVLESVGDQEAVVFLNEHFRSRPGIIDFSNREFYGGRLLVMTSHREIGHDLPPAVSLTKCDGERDTRGVNVAEIDEILRQLDALVAEGGTPLSVGILSPFRDQVEAVLKRLEKRTDLAVLLDRHRLLVGTAHSFQGEERDVIFLSLVLDDESPAMSFRFLEKEDVFNVSITRARRENRVMVSFERSGAAREGLLGRYLAAATVGTTGEVPGRKSRSGTRPLLGKLAMSLENRGLSVGMSDPGEGEASALIAIGAGGGWVYEEAGSARGPAIAGASATRNRHRRAGLRWRLVGEGEWEARGEEMVRLDHGRGRE